MGALLAKSSRRGLLDSAAGASCRVRLLRKDGGTDYVWATCTRPGEGADAPVRLVGSHITVAANGDEKNSPNALDRIFPKDIASAIRADETRYKPV